MDNLWQKVENIVTKGEIARFVQFLLLLPYYVFKKLSAAEASESVYMRERVKTFSTNNKSLADDFENIYRKNTENILKWKCHF